MASTSDGLLTPMEASVYLLTHRSPGLSQTEIAAEKGVHQATVSRVLQVATAKVEELKTLLDRAGGDPDVVDQYLMRVETGADARQLPA